MPLPQMSPALFLVAPPADQCPPPVRDVVAQWNQTRADYIAVQSELAALTKPEVLDAAKRADREALLAGGQPGRAVADLQSKVELAQARDSKLTETIPPLSEQVLMALRAHVDEGAAQARQRAGAHVDALARELDHLHEQAAAAFASLFGVAWWRSIAAGDRSATWRDDGTIGSVRLADGESHLQFSDLAAGLRPFRALVEQLAAQVAEPDPEPGPPAAAASRPRRAS